jgi:REDY-like protein HapK
MSKIMILYRLKADVTREQYESWTRNTDYPTMRGLQRVESFVNHRAIRHLLDEEKPSVDYIEVFDVPDLAGFLSEDLGGSVVQQIMGEFMQYVENPEFIVLEEVT